MTEAENKAAQAAKKEQENIDKKAAKDAAEKVARENAEKAEAEKAKAKDEKDAEKKADEKELKEAQEKRVALFKKPLFKVMKVNVIHNGICYDKGNVCPDSRIELFEEKGFIEEL